MAGIDHRAAATERIEGLVVRLQALPDSPARAALLSECQALTRAIAAFHMEGIRFRMFNVDRLMTKGGIVLPPEAFAAFTEARRHLEEAGFHTRSH